MYYIRSACFFFYLVVDAHKSCTRPFVILTFLRYRLLFSWHDYIVAAAAAQWIILDKLPQGETIYFCSIYLIIQT